MENQNIERPAMEFKLECADSSEMEIMLGVEAASLPESLPHSKTDMVRGRFGSMYFQHFQGHAFDIWYSHYHIRKGTAIKARMDSPVLELHISLENHFENWWDGIGQPTYKRKGFNMSYTPFVQNKAVFEGGKQYRTFDIHFRKELLEGIAPSYPKLYEFLNRVEQGRPCSLSKEPCYMDHTMERLVQECIDYRFHAGVSHVFYDSKAMELLLNVLHQVEVNQTAMQRFRPEVLDKTREAEQLLHVEGPFIKISDLARMVALNECHLKQCFKEIFESTIFDYQRTMKMEYAKEALLKSPFTVADIALHIGFPDSNNFSTSFKKVTGYTPTQWRQMHSRMLQ
jgi:AraC-like DNA-binding protein